MEVFFRHFQEMSFSSGSGPYRSGWGGVAEKREKNVKKTGIFGKNLSKICQKSAKWVRGPPYTPQKMAIFGIFAKNDQTEKSRKSNPGFVSDFDKKISKNSKNPKNGPKPQKSTFLKKVPFWHFLTPWSKMGSILDPPKNQRSQKRP